MNYLTSATAQLGIKDDRDTAKDLVRMHNSHGSPSGFEVADEASVSSQGGKVRPILIVSNAMYGGATRGPNWRQRGVTFALPSDNTDPFEKDDGKFELQRRIRRILTKHEKFKLVRT